MRWFLALAAAAAVVAPATAADVRFADGTPVTLQAVGQLYEKTTGRNLDDRWVRVAAGGFAPLSQPDPKAKASGAAGVPFLARLNMLGDPVQGTAGMFCLVAAGGIGDAKLDILGWVPAAYVITGSRCLEDEKSGILIKAMAINSLQYLKAGGVPDDERAAPPRLLASPPPFRGADFGPARFFDFYFVWADTDRENEDKGFALIAENPSVNANAAVSDDDFRRLSKIIGWIDKSRLCFWRTREAVQWNDLDPSRPNPGRAYATAAHAKAEYDPAFKGPTETDAPVTEVFTGGRPAAWDPRRMRYPLLTLRVPDGTAADGSPRTKEAPYESFARNTLRRVGVIGDVFDEKGQPVMSEAARQGVQLDMIRAREQLRRTEILFVIDRTVSMKNWWKATADSVDRMIAQVNRDGRSVAVGFCFYGDINPGSPDREGKAANLKEAIDAGAVRPGRLLDARTDAAALREKLKELADPNDIPGGGRLEMVYAGLEVGIIEARGWSKNARKMVILIGDDGNHRLPDAEEKEVHERIAELLDPTPDAAAAAADYETPKEFYALQVCKVDDRPGDPTQLFKAQTELLMKRIKERSKDARVGYYNTAQEDQFLAEIERRYAELKAQADGTAEWLQKAQSGQVKAVTEIRDPEAVNILRGIAARRKLRLEDLIQGVQAFDERYVWELDPQTKDRDVRQLRRMILVSEGELSRVLDMFGNFFHNPENPPSLDQLATLLLDAQAGDPRAGAGVKGLGKGQRLDQMRVTYGFSFVSELSAFLGYNLAPGAKAPDRNAAAEQAFKRQLQKKFLLLEDIKEGRTRDYVALDAQDTLKLRPVAGSDRPLAPAARRGFKRGDGSITFYWIDFDREWP